MCKNTKVNLHRVFRAFIRSFIDNPNVTYYHIDDYQIDMIVRDRIYIIKITNILSFLYPSDDKEKEIIKHLENLYKKRVIILKQPKRYSLTDLFNIIKNFKIKTK